MKINKLTMLAVMLGVMGTSSLANDLSLYERLTEAYVASTNKFSVFKELSSQDKAEYLKEFCTTQSISHADESFGLPQYIINLVEALHEEDPMLGDYVYWDSRFDQINAMIRPSWWSIDIDRANRKNFPRCWDNWAKGPVSEAVKDERPATNRYLNNEDEAISIPCALNYYIELRATGNISVNSISSQNKNIINLLLPKVRRHMRQLGESIVTVGETNPVQEKVNEIISALEAPRCAGFKELVLRYYPDFDWIDVKFLTDDEINSLKDEVYNGDVRFSENRASLLFVHLGVTAYNEFIREYNGDN